jgi:hypothetical protein
VRVLLRWLGEKWSSGSICFDRLRSPIIGGTGERTGRPMRPVRKSICSTKTAFSPVSSVSQIVPLPYRVANKSEETPRSQLKLQA